MTPKELGELAHLEEAVPIVDLGGFPAVEADERLDPGLRKSVEPASGLCRPCSGQTQAHGLRLLCQAASDRRRWQSRAADRRAHRARRYRGSARGTGETYEVAASLVITAIGYSTSPIAERTVRGRQVRQPEWPHLRPAVRGRLGPPRTDRNNRHEPARRLRGRPIRSPRKSPAGTSENGEGSAGLKRLLESRGVMPTDYDDWRKIEETEVGRARPGSPREKFVRHQDWLASPRSLIAGLRSAEPASI